MFLVGVFFSIGKCIKVLPFFRYFAECDSVLFSQVWRARVMHSARRYRFEDKVKIYDTMKNTIGTCSRFSRPHVTCDACSGF